MEFTKEIKTYLWQPAMDGNLGCTEISCTKQDNNVDLVDISHQELVLYLENKLSADRRAFVQQAIQHPFYQDVITGMQMMIEDIDELNTYEDVEDYLEQSKRESLEALT